MFSSPKIILQSPYFSDTNINHNTIMCASSKLWNEGKHENLPAVYSRNDARFPNWKSHIKLHLKIINGWQYTNNMFQLTRSNLTVAPWLVVTLGELSDLVLMPHTTTPICYYNIPKKNSQHKHHQQLEEQYTTKSYRREYHKSYLWMSIFKCQINGGGPHRQGGRKKFRNLINGRLAFEKRF